MDEDSWKSVKLLGTESLKLRAIVELHVVGLITCEREGLVVGDEAPVGGVAQVIGHGVQVVEVGVQVRVHEEGEKGRGR